LSCCRLESTAKTRRAYLRTESRALGTPFVIDGRDVRIGVTVGIALAPPDGVTLDRLAACADAALYQAKHKGRGSVVIAGERPAASAPATAA